MARLLDIHEVDEFSKVKRVPKESITSEIISGIRQLDEANELERFIREILYDPNETPHGPTEIADILTHHVHLAGESGLAAFVLKGKSFRRVTSKNVTHQFAKVRQIPDLCLMAFCAVGDIQDDARRDFAQVAIDACCDYLIIDAHDLARLLIAYERVCPRDGTPYDETGTCSNGHIQDQGITLEVSVREKIHYTIVRQTDVSHAGAKRYSGTILLDRHYSRDIIRQIIQEATEELTRSNYYRNEQVEARWEGTPAHVVWLFVAYDLADIPSANWVCRSCWIDGSLSDDMHPGTLNGNDKVGDIEVLWNDAYEHHKTLFEQQSGTKEEVLKHIRPLLKEVIALAQQAASDFEDYKAGRLPEKTFISEMQARESRASELYRQSGEIPQPPEDCKDYEETCQLIFATVDNMFLLYSEKGLETWPQKNRDWLMTDVIRRYRKDLERLRFEESKLN